MRTQIAVRFLVLTAYLLTNVAFSPDHVQRAFAAPAPSADFWKARQSAIPRPVEPVAAPRAPAANAPGRLAAVLDRISPFLALRSLHATGNGPAVVIVQDIHLNPEAQRNIGSALGAVLDAGEPAIVAVEAASGAFDFRPYRLFPDASATREIADALLASNRLSAVSWAGLTARNAEPVIVGVDDDRLYRENVAAYRDAAARKDAARASVATLIASLEARKGELPAALARAYDRSVAYHAGTLPIGDYLRGLSDAVPDGRFPNARRLLAAIESEQKIDPDAARRDRDRLISALSHDRAALAELARLAGDASGRGEPVAFYGRLVDVARSAGHDLAAYPALRDYVRYLELAGGIRHEALFEEIRRLSDGAADRLARTPGEKRLFQDLLRARVAERLIDFELTPDEWADYARDPNPGLERFADFYETALARDEAMARNLLAEIDRRGARVTVLVAGGFHSPGLLRRLQAKGARTALLSPRLAKVDLGQGSDYLNAFLRDRTPLAQVFRGEKLTLGDAALLLGAPAFGARPPAAAQAGVGLLQSLAAVQDGTVTESETAAVKAALKAPRAKVRPGRGRSAVVQARGDEVEIGPDVPAADDAFENVFGHPLIGVRTGREGWLRRNADRLATIAAAGGALAVVAGFAGGYGYEISRAAIALGILGYAGFRLALFIVSRAPDNRRIVGGKWWQRIYGLFPVRLYVNGTGRTGVPNLLFALHAPGFRVVAVNGLENNADGSTKLEALASLIENDEVYGDFGDYNVTVLAAGRAWVDAAGQMRVTRNARPDELTFAGETTDIGTGVWGRIRAARTRRWAGRMIARLDRRQPDWRRAWASETKPDGEARLEWLDIRVGNRFGGRVRRVLFFNARGERTKYFPARALNIVAVSETSGAALDRRALVPYINGSDGNGAQIAVLGAPPRNKADRIPLAVMGVNHDRIAQLVDIVISNCSCTTNGGVPLLFALAMVPRWIGRDPIEVVRGHMTTTHGPTVSDQDLIDVPKAGAKSEGRSPASGAQTIATTTGFLDVAKPVLESAGVAIGPITGISFRVPANPSEVTLTLDVKGRLNAPRAIRIFLIAAGVTDPETIRALLAGVNEVRFRRGEEPVLLNEVLLSRQEAAAADASQMKGIIRLISEPESPSLKYGQWNASTILNLAHLSLSYDEATDETRVNLYSWYANEWGYAARTLETLRAFAARYWQRKGLLAFLLHALARRLPAPETLEPADAEKKKEKPGKAAVAIDALPDFVFPTPPSANRPYVALSFDGSDKQQLNKALLYVWNYLRGDREVELRAVMGLGDRDAQAAFAKMLKRPTGYEPLAGRWAIVQPGDADSFGANDRDYPVLRYYAGSGTPVEIALLRNDSAAVLPPLTHTVSLGSRAPPVAGTPAIRPANDGEAGVHIPVTERTSLTAPADRALSGRALAGYHLVSALARLPGRVTQVSVKEIVSSKGDKPILTRLRGRRAEGNTQMEPLSSQEALEAALAARGIAAPVTGETDVVNNQSGALVQVTASLDNETTAADVKAAVEAQVADMAALRYRLVALDGARQIFSSDAFAGRPAIFINTDSIEVNGGRQVTVTAWFDDRMADLNALNETVVHEHHAPFVGPILEKYGPVAENPIEIQLTIHKDGVSVRERRVEVMKGGRYYGERVILDDVTETLIPIERALPLILAQDKKTGGANVTGDEVTVTIPAGEAIAPFITNALAGFGMSGGTEKRLDAINLIRRLDQNDAGPWIAELFDRVVHAWDGTMNTVPSYLSEDYMVPYLRAVTIDRLERICRMAIETYPTAAGWQDNRRLPAVLGVLQRAVLTRLGDRATPEAERVRLIRLNRDLFSTLVEGMATIREAESDPDAYAAEILAGFAFSENEGLPYGSRAWREVGDDTWQRFKTALRPWIERRELNQIARLKGGSSFVPVMGYGNWTRILRVLFDNMMQRMGKMDTHAWIWGESAGPTISAIWRQVDASGDERVKRAFYRTASSYAMDPDNMAAWIDAATEDPLLEPRMLSLLSVVYLIQRWEFVDNRMPFAFLSYALAKKGPYPLLRYKRMLSQALLSKAPTMLGLPGDGDLKDRADSGKSFSPDWLYNDIFDLDSAIHRQVAFIGIDQRATDLVAARFEYWKTGDPAKAVEVLARDAAEQTATWRASAKKTAPRRIVRRLFELIAAAKGVAPEAVPVTVLVDMTIGELGILRDELKKDPEFAEADDEIKRLFNVDIELYQGLASRFSPLQTDVVALRALSASDIRINKTNLQADVYNIDRLIHREVHHGTGEHTLSLVEARFDYWRTGDVAPAVWAAGRWAPKYTQAWRSDPDGWLKDNPAAGKHPAWFALVNDLFNVMAEQTGIMAFGLPTSALATASDEQLSNARAALTAMGTHSTADIAQLFDREIMLYRLLRNRYDPVGWETALDRLREEKDWPVDAAPLLNAIDAGADPIDVLAVLAQTRELLAEKLLGHSSTDKYNRPEEADYSYQHGILGVYGFVPNNPFYKAHLMDLALRPVEERILETARAALPKEGDEVTPAVVEKAARVLAAGIGLLEATGWANQPLRNYRQLLDADTVFHQRAALVCHRILNVYEDLGIWSDRHWGPMIDAISYELPFERVAESVLGSLKVSGPSGYEEARLRLRTHMQGEFLRTNIPLFFVKDVALLLKGLLDEATPPERESPDFDARPVVEFPAAVFGKPPAPVVMGVQSEKAANLVRMTGMLGQQKNDNNMDVDVTVPVPPGKDYPIGMSLDAIHERVWEDVQDIMLAIREQGLEEHFGDGQHHPVLFAVRSGAIFDAPGQQDTITNVGLSEENLDRVADRIGEWAAWDSLRRFYQEYAMAVHRMPRGEFRAIIDGFKDAITKPHKKDFTAAEMRDLARLYKQKIEAKVGENAIPESADDQLVEIIRAIQRSWDDPTMADYRRANGMTDEEGTGIVLQAQVHGNYTKETGTGHLSGAGAAIFGTWPWEELGGSFAEGVAGSDIADGVITPESIGVLKDRAPDVYTDLLRVMRLLHERIGTKVEVEYTVQNGKLWVLQVRTVPEEAALPGFDAKAQEAASVLADGYALAGKAAVGPLVSMHHLRQARALVEGWIGKQEDAVEARRGFLIESPFALAQALQLTMMNDQPDPDPSLQVVIEALETVAALRAEQPSHADQIGVIVGSDEAVPEDLPFIRFLNELSGTTLVVGSISNQGGPGTHEQENALHLKLTSMAGTSQGSSDDWIIFGPNPENEITFQRGETDETVVREGGIISIGRRGSRIKDREMIEVYLGALPFEKANGYADPTTDSIFGADAWAATRVAPVVEESLFRLLPFVIAPLVVLTAAFPAGPWLSLAALPATALLFAAAVAVSVLGHAAAHAAADGRAFFTMLPYRLGRAAVYTGSFLLQLAPALPAIVLLAAGAPLFGDAAAPTIAAVQSAVFAAAGLRAFALVTARHARHNRGEVLRRSVTSFLSSADASPADQAVLVEFLKAQGLETLRLSEWTRSRPGAATADAWTPFDADVDPATEAAHFSMADLSAAGADPVLRKTPAFRAALRALARLAGDGAVVVTISPDESPEAARAALARLLAANGVTVSAAALDRVALDASAKANPFLVAERFKTLLGGRRLRAMPFHGPSLANWVLTDFLDGSADRSDVLIEIVRLLTGDSLRVTPTLMKSIQAAAIAATQA